MVHQSHAFFRDLLLIIIFCSYTFQVYGYHCRPYERYRRYDGSCNNLKHPSWGKANTEQRRFINKLGRQMVDYGDGTNTPRGHPDGNLPSARRITNLISDESLSKYDLFDKHRSGNQYTFAQLLTHDFIQSKLQSGVECCNKTEPRRHDINICFPIKVPKHDKHFPPGGCINLNRAARAPGYVGSLHIREQLNLITSVIDASFLYGSSKKTVKSLRKPLSFLMKTDGPGELLPTITGGQCLKIQKKDKCTRAGDTRHLEQPGLSMSHLIWVREHNYLARQLHILNPKWCNERVFEEARRIIIAMLQHLTYNHFLPTILNDKTMRKYHLYSKKTGYDDVYNCRINPSVFNAFAIAAFRYGHSQVHADFSLLSSDKKTTKMHKIENQLETPHLLQKHNGAFIQSSARWLTFTKTMKIDNFLTEGIRSKLFHLTTPHGQDLFALNIQRGRDHGVPAYNKWREFCGLRKFRCFSDFGKFGWKLARLYKHVDDVDLFIGGLMEKDPKGGVGPTFACLIGKQFFSFKFGDRYWYESNDTSFAFTPEQLESIKQQTSYSKIYCRNADLPEIQENTFLIPSRKNKIQRCDSLPDINLYLWKDETSHRDDKNLYKSTFDSHKGRY